MGRRTKRPVSNLLEMIPLLRPHLDTVEDDEGKVTLLLPRTSWLERQSIRYLKQPAWIKVYLDELGSSVVSHCNGQYTVAEIASNIKRKFGAEAEPLHPRLSKYLEVLEANGWLTWLQSEADDGEASAGG
ncbi:PqqD family protein [Paenibacillus vini]|uniref:PqqD family protein n=1 Tax=Paenibacillus vini TaxID=1476024 RepID=UPI0025B6BFB6|nr:PqqD family protein [Paenibacillus vini]MDN4066939.1 PqqD family protein [Paenibacillus vini]